MRPEEWERVERIFEEALRHPRDQRADLIRRECGSDAALQALVVRMLDEHERHPGFLETPVGGTLGRARERLMDPESPDETRIGPYRLVRPLGRGGMGEVHLAERRMEDVVQPVALKILRPGLGDGLRGRFGAERRILGALRHPNVAALLDVGTTDDRRPYLVMEYVDGAPLVEHCDGRRLTIRDRVALMVTVCEAVQHAHRSLVVHRDLKPSNILVDERGEPKLLDFGIAKILDDEGPGDVTRVEDRAYTPEYAAPEQIRGEAVTTACDVYALGVLLHRLLSGEHPFEAVRSDRRALERAVEEGRPGPLVPAADTPGGAGPKRAADLEARASARATTPSALRKELAGDLEAIVGRAMDPDPARRYPSAGSLADDLHRYLQGEPVAARPPSRLYRMRKFVGRHRVAVGAAAAILIVLVTTAGALAVQAERLRERSVALAEERDKAMEVRSFLLEMFGTTGPDVTGDSVTARQLLDARAATVQSEFGANPATLAEMSLVLAEGYDRLGLFPEAEGHARRSVDLRRAMDPPDPEALAEALNVLGWVRHRAGHDEEAAGLLRESVALWADAPGEREGAARALNDLGVVLEARGDPDGAAERYAESLALRDRLGQGGSTGAAVTASNLAVVHYRRGEYTQAIAMAERAHGTLRSTMGEEHQRTLVVEANLAAMKAAAGDVGGAVAMNEAILARRLRRFGESHPDVAASRALLGVQLRQLGRFDEAEAHLARAVSTLESLGGEPTPALAHARLNHGSVLADLERTDDAVAELERSVAAYRALPGSPRAELGSALVNLGWVLERAGDGEGAELRYRDAIDALTRSVGEEHWRTGQALQQLGELLADRDPEAAVPTLERAEAVLAASFPPGHDRMLRLGEHLARARRAVGDVDAADSIQAVVDSIRGSG